MNTPAEVQFKGPPKRILVVEDQAEVSKAIRMVLAFGGGHRVETAEDGECGLAKFNTGVYDLVITDLQMPKMTGLELARQIKQRVPAQPILLITAFSGAIAGDGEALTKIDGILEKPFSLQQLQHVLARFFPPAALEGDAAPQRRSE